MEKELYRKISKGVYSFGKQEVKNQAGAASFSMQPTSMMPNYTNIPGCDTFMANRPIDTLAGKTHRAVANAIG